MSVNIARAIKGRDIVVRLCHKRSCLIAVIDKATFLLKFRYNKSFKISWIAVQEAMIQDCCYHYSTTLRPWSFSKYRDTRAK